mgnify:CR=1 FL=1
MGPQEVWYLDMTFGANLRTFFELSGQGAFLNLLETFFNGNWVDS